MPTTIPAMRGQFGTTEYFLTTMHIGELIQKVQFASELDGWEELNVEDKYQREISLKRVREQIAPYFAKDADRFSGSLVLAVMNNEAMIFEDLDGMIGKTSAIPQLYRSSTRDIGFLTFQGAEVLIPLDGQHRAKAFKYAINGMDDNNRPIANMRANQELARDQVSVVLIRWDNKKARYIFNKINRNAKRTSASDNLITDDDDAMAVMTREFISDDGGLLPASLVNISSNTLNSAAREFTTLATFYDATCAIFVELGIPGAGKPQEMNQEQREVATPDVRAIWERLLSGVDLFREALGDTAESGDAVRKRIREETLLGKPIGQLALVRAFMLMREKCLGISDDALCRRLNLIDWSVGNEMWHGVLMNPNGRVMSGKGTVNRAHEFIAHLGGAQLTDDEMNRLLEHIHGDDWENHKLPAPVA